MTERNRKILLASRPQGAATEQNFRIVDAPLPEPAEGEVLVKNEWLSLDPYMRGRMSDAKSYVPPAQLDEVMVGQTVGEVIRSRDATIEVGEKVLTQLGWQSHGVAKAADVTKVDARARTGVVLSRRPRHAGADRLVRPLRDRATQGRRNRARLRGVRRRRQRRGPARENPRLPRRGHRRRQGQVRLRRQRAGLRCVRRLHRAGNLYEDLRAACPDGVDVDFENVGGAVLDTALRVMNRHSRVVICGLVAEYSAKDPYGYRGLRSVLVNRIRMQGMIIFDWKDRYKDALPTLTSYVAEGKLKYRESIVDGLDNAPRALIALLKGENFGKQLVRMA